jgi:hypothetical protein
MCILPKGDTVTLTYSLSCVYDKFGRRARVVSLIRRARTHETVRAQNRARRVRPPRQHAHAPAHAACAELDPLLRRGVELEPRKRRLRRRCGRSPHAQHVGAALPQVALLSLADIGEGVGEDEAALDEVDLVRATDEALVPLRVGEVGQERLPSRNRPMASAAAGAAWSSMEQQEQHGAAGAAGAAAEGRERPWV